MLRGFRGESAEDRLVNRLISESESGLLAQGFPKRDAKTMARDLVLSVRNALVANSGDRTSVFAEGVGDQIVAQRYRHPQIDQHLKMLDALGVSAEDFSRWHNLSKLERKVLLKSDEWLMLATFSAAREEGKSDEEAGKLVAQIYARYTEAPENIGRSVASDLLPAELKLRVDAYRDARLRRDPTSFNAEVRQAGNFNAFVRQKMKQGEL